MSLQTFDSFTSRVDPGTRKITATVAFKQGEGLPALSADTLALEILLSDGDNFVKIEKSATDIQAWLDASSNDYRFEIATDLSTFGPRLIIVAAEKHLDGEDVPIPTSTSTAEAPVYAMVLDNSSKPDACVLSFRDKLAVVGSPDTGSMDMTGSVVATLGANNGSDFKSLRLFITRRNGSAAPSLVQYEHAVTAGEIATGEIVIDFSYLSLAGLETGERFSITASIDTVQGLESNLSAAIHDIPTLQLATPSITSINSGAAPNLTEVQLDFTALQNKNSFYYKLYKKYASDTEWSEVSATSYVFSANIDDEGVNVDTYLRTATLSQLSPLSKCEIAVAVSYGATFIINAATGNPTAASNVTQSNRSSAKKVMVGGAAIPGMDAVFSELSGSNVRINVTVTNDPTATATPVARVVISVYKNDIAFQLNNVFAYNVNGYSLPQFNVNTMEPSDVFNVIASFHRSLSPSEITYYVTPAVETALWGSTTYSVISLGQGTSEDNLQPPVGLFIGSAPKPTISALFETVVADDLKFIIQMNNTNTEAELIDVYVAYQIQFRTVSNAVETVLAALDIENNQPEDIYLSNNPIGYAASTTYEVSSRYLFSSSLTAGPWSDAVSITTEAEPPLPGATNVVLTCTNGAANVTWDAVVPGTGIPDGYLMSSYSVDLKNSVGVTIATQSKAASPLAPGSASFSDLITDTSYTSFVTAIYTKTLNPDIGGQLAYSGEVYLNKIPIISGVSINLTEPNTVSVMVTIDPGATPQNVSSVIVVVTYLNINDDEQLFALAAPSSNNTVWATTALTRAPGVDYNAIKVFVIAQGPGGASYTAFP